MILRVTVTCPECGAEFETDVECDPLPFSEPLEDAPLRGTKELPWSEPLDEEDE